MRKSIFVLLLSICFVFTTKAQYVNIPDSNFRSFLITKYPSCFNGAKQMDTTCNDILNEIFLNCSSLSLSSLIGVQYFKKLKALWCTNNLLTNLPTLPDSLSELLCQNNQLTSLPSLPAKLTGLSCSYNFLTSLPKLPSMMDSLFCSNNTNLSCLTKLPNANQSHFLLNIQNTNIQCLPNNSVGLIVLSGSLPICNITNNFNNCYAPYVNIPDSNFGKFLITEYPSCLYKDSINKYWIDTTCSEIINETTLYCSFQSISNISGIEYFKNLKTFFCSNNQLASLPNLPNSITALNCSNNNLTTLPILSEKLVFINIDNNPITILPNIPDSLATLHAYNTELTDLSVLPNTLIELVVSESNIECLPRLPQSLRILGIDTNKIHCLPNKLHDSAVVGYFYLSPPYVAIPYYNIPLCNPTNNSNQCQSFPVIKSFAYTDLNSNNKLDTNELPKHNLKISFSNNNYSYTNTQGITYNNADSLGTYTITATAPNFYNAVPASYTHSFATYDTLVIDTFALQVAVLKDSIATKLTAINWAARPGFAYPFIVSYENAGTTVISNAIANLQYDNSLLNYDSSSNSLVTNSGSSLSLNIGTLLPGQTGSFVAYFKVKTSATLGSSLLSIANITSGLNHSVDTAATIISGSYDPNDKQATPILTTQQVDEGKYIDYTIRFQNTGTDTAFSVVIADTLDSKLQANQLQMIGSSHSCKTTIKDNIIFFEFLDIMLPDSNTNKVGSNGFVSFKVKPISTVASGTTIPNKAAIYFDYNSPIITKPATTIIQNPLPLHLLNFSAVIKKESNEILAYWHTANELNTAYFILEQSCDGIAFKAAAEIAAKGSGSNSYFYAITNNKVSYIRLKMVDKNGQFTYSNIIKVNTLIEDLNGLIVVNSPAKNYLQLKVNTVALSNTNASLVAANGKVVKSFVLNQGNQLVNISQLSSGLYYLKTNAAIRKIVVEK